jgi:uncharacterized protein (TIGR02217 family)
MAFDNVQLPVNIEQGAVFGPSFSTTVLSLSNGFEQRNQNRVRSIGQGDISYGVQTKTDYEVVRAFFYSRRGRAVGFRFKDWSDFQSNGPQTLGTGTGSLHTFQLINLYADSLSPFTRKITRPVSGTMQVFDNGVLKTEGIDYTVDYTGGTGIITFGTAPLNTHVITANFQFDTPVRFDSDVFSITMDQIEAGSVNSITIVEILE